MNPYFDLQGFVPFLGSTQAIPDYPGPCWMIRSCSGGHRTKPLEFIAADEGVNGCTFAASESASVGGLLGNVGSGVLHLLARGLLDQ